MESMLQYANVDWIDTDRASSLLKFISQQQRN